VHRGAERPLLRPLRTAEFIGGPDGLDGASLPPPTIAAHATHAVPAIVDLLRAAPDGGITLCALGPLTNVALALAQDRALVRKLARIVMMGGSRDLGNITPAAEFNFFVDPHAAQIVLGCGAPIVLFGLHATHQAMGTPERMAKLSTIDTPVARAVHGMFERPRPGGLARFGVAGHPVHDPCVIAYLLWPELFQGRDCHVAVETTGETTIGRSVIDWWGGSARANAHVIERIDADPLFARMIERLGRLK